MLYSHSHGKLVQKRKKNYIMIEQKIQPIDIVLPNRTSVPVMKSIPLHAAISSWIQPLSVSNSSVVRAGVPFKTEEMSKDLG